MYTTLASVALGSAALWSTAAACQYTERASSVVEANDALRVPISSTGPGAQNECAATAQAFGMTTASIVPGVQGGAECVLYGAMAADTCGTTYELHTGGKTLSNITGCDAAVVKAVSDGAIALAGAGAEAPVGGSTAVKVLNTAAVGKAVHSDLSYVTEEECLVACTEYITGCTHVTIMVEQGKMPRCSFHGSPTQGVQVQGANTYYDIVPSPQLASRALGAAIGDAAAPAVAPAVAPTLAPTPAPTPAVAPAPVPEAVVEPDLAPAAVPEAGLMGPTNAIEELVFSPPGTCPGGVITDVPAGKSEPSLQPPEQVVELYVDAVGDDGKFPMAYGEIVNGGAYCVAKGSTAPTVIVGGMFFWDDGGECVAPPTNDAGESCCDAFMWQPNTAGLYYDNCSMKMAIQPNGLYYFETEMPGDESINGWGPDPEPHIHFDIICSGCSGDHPVVAGDYQYWNKFYPETLCTIAGCGDQGPEHQATELAAGGQTVYKYDFILPGETRTQNRRRK